MDYDENLSRNDFFHYLKNNHQILLETAPIEGWIICVPRSGSLHYENILNSDLVLAHVLIPNDELPGTHFINLLGYKVNAINKKITLEIERKFIEALILFEEVFYTKDGMKYKVWCIDGPLIDMSSVQKTHSNSNKTILYTVNTLQDASDLLRQEIKSKIVFRRIENICNDFIKSAKKNTNIDSIDHLKEAVKRLFNHCLNILIGNRAILKQKCSRDSYFLQNVKLALETFIMNILYKFLFDAITVYYLDGNESFNKKMRSMSDLHLSDYKIDARFKGIIPQVKMELCKIDECTTSVEKLNCLKVTLNTISRNKIQPPVCSDEMIPILVFAIVKSGLSHWITTLVFLKEFIYTGQSDIGADSYLITTLEAVILYIQSDGIFHQSTGNSSPSNVTQFTSKQQFLSHLFHNVKNNNENEVFRLIRANATPLNQTVDADILEFRDISLLGLCHPLCDCSSCRLKVAETVPDVNSQNSSGQTALHIAAKYGPPKMLNLILSLGGHVNAIDHYNVTPVHLAAANGQQNTLLLLLHANAIIDARTSEGNTPLHMACQNGHERCVKAILYFADHMKMPIDINSVNNFGNTPLHLAAKWGFLGIVESLIEFGAKTDIKNKSELTAVEIAHNSRVQQLMNESFVFVVNNDTRSTNRFESSEINHQNGKNVHGFSTAANVSTILSNYIPILPTKLTKISPSTTTTTNGDLMIAEEHIHQMKKIMKAIAQGDTNLVYFYLNIEKVSNQIMETKIVENHCHPLCECGKCGNSFPPETRKDNCRGKTNTPSINLNSSIDDEGTTLLHVATLYGNLDLIRTLLEYGSNPSIQTKTSHQTPLHIACEKANYDATNALLNYATNNMDLIDLTDFNGDTALHVAIRSGDMKLVKLILIHEPDLEIKNQKGQYPIDLARGNMLYGVVKILEGIESGECSSEF